MKTLAIISILVLAMVSGCRLESNAPISEAMLAEPATIGDIIQRSNSMQTFYSGLLQTNLAQAMKDQGPYTLFVPTQQAWDKLPAGQRDNLFKPENADMLRNVISNHIVAGGLRASDLATREWLTTINNNTLPLRHVGLQSYVGTALITEPDVAATNGFINVIDTVLLPAR